MQSFQHILILILLLAGLNVLGRRLPWPLPITYAVGAALIALWPEFPRVELHPNFFFLFFVPPLLFADGWLMPLRDFIAARRPIFSLATVLVLFTTVAVGYAAHWLIPNLPLAMGFALGAVISPTDAVAVGAIVQRLKVPARLSTVLNGESLMNDATGLVAFKFALAAVAAGTFSVRDASLSFLWVAIGGIVIGLAVTWVVGLGRDFLQKIERTDTFIEITISLLTPFAAYLAADALGLSSILSVVAAGLYSGWRDPLKMTPETRLATMSVWAVMLFWLNGLAFILLGLQFPSLLANISLQYTPQQLVIFTAVISGVAILARLVWIFPAAYLPALLFPKAMARAKEKTPSWQMILVTGWAGMRGTITLAAALSIPLVMADGSPFPGRDIVIFLSFGVIAVTLLVQGTTLEALICKLGLPAETSHLQEERLARTAAVESGLKTLRELSTNAANVEETAAIGQIIGEYEQRLAELTAEGETRTSAARRRRSARRHRLHALRSERKTIDDLWRRDIISDEIHHPLQQLLDYEESMLSRTPDQAET